MAKKHNIDWLNHGLEFIVVFVGILIAFQLNTCKDNSKEAVVVQKHYDNILEESILNKKLFLASIKDLEQLEATLDSLQNLLVLDNSTAQQLNPLVFKALNLGYLYIKQSAYNSLRNSNDIRFIDDFEIKNDIVNLYENYFWTEAIQTQNFKGYNDRYFNYFINNFDLTKNKPQPIDRYKNLKFKNIVATYKYAIATRLNREKNNLEMLNAFLEKHINTAKK